MWPDILGRSCQTTSYADPGSDDNGYLLPCRLHSPAEPRERATHAQCAGGAGGRIPPLPALSSRPAARSRARATGSRDRSCASAHCRGVSRHREHRAPGQADRLQRPAPGSTLRRAHRRVARFRRPGSQGASRQAASRRIESVDHQYCILGGLFERSANESRDSRSLWLQPVAAASKAIPGRSSRSTRRRAPPSNSLQGSSRRRASDRVPGGAGDSRCRDRGKWHVPAHHEHVWFSRCRRGERSGRRVSSRSHDASGHFWLDHRASRAGARALWPAPR